LSWCDPVQNLAELGQILSSRSRSRFEPVGHGQNLEVFGQICQILWCQPYGHKFGSTSIIWIQNGCGLDFR